MKAEKAQLLEDILDAERQVMLWEKKIQLEKDTQAALDPSVRCAYRATGLKWYFPKGTFCT